MAAAANRRRSVSSTFALALDPWQQSLRGDAAALPQTHQNAAAAAAAGKKELQQRRARRSSVPSIMNHQGQK